MATLATILDRFMAVKGSERTAPRTRVMELEDPFVVPQFPNEDVFFYMKRISNADVLRETDPAARRVCWTMIGSTFALAIVVIDNPMAAGTGHRICNDCMKSCIFQKQEPVDIPQVETRSLKDVLELPWRLEISSLLTRWNPLHFARPYPRAASGYNPYETISPTKNTAAPAMSTVSVFTRADAPVPVKF